MSKQTNVFKALLQHRSLALSVVLLLAGARAHAQLQTEPPPPRPIVSGRSYIVSFRPGTSQADRAASVRRAGAILRFNYSLVDAVAVTADTNALAALQRDISVLEIIPDRPVRAFQVAEGNANGKGPGGSGGGGGSTQTVPEGVKRVSPCSATNTCSTTGSAIGVAIIDTGVDLTHSDLSGGIGGTYSAFGGSCQDDNGHGTHVAGIVGARYNTTDVVGVAPNSTLYCAKVLDAAGNGSDATVMAGLDWVAQTDGITKNSQGICSLPTNSTPPIRVVNMSLGRPGTLGDNTALRASVTCLYDNGIVVVVAAGNDSSAEVSQMIPAGYPEVLAIASSTAIAGGNAGCRFFRDTIKADTASYFTTDGKLSAQNIGVTISAPGADKEDVSKSCFASSVGILSLKLGGGTTRMSGTSMAAPHVAGIAARLMQAKGYGGNRAPGGYSLSYLGVDTLRSDIRVHASQSGDPNDPNAAPLDSPTNGYSFDGEREGIAQAPQ